MTKPAKQQPKKQNLQNNQSKRKRGRPEKQIKIDDTPLNVARSFSGIPSDKFTRTQS
jgi:hypothetical protein